VSGASLLTIADVDIVEFHLVCGLVEIFVNREGTKGWVVRNTSPIVVTLVSFWHFTVIRGQVLTPSIAFTSVSMFLLSPFPHRSQSDHVPRSAVCVRLSPEISRVSDRHIVFNKLKFALNTLPQTFLSMLQCFVSLRRIEKYLNGAEVAPIPPLSQQSKTITLQSATITWPQDHSRRNSTPSVPSTPGNRFTLLDLSLQFPEGGLSLICGKLGSGKTLLLLGRSLCPQFNTDTIG
jgi:ABC-type multidrug transport system fused ATPase/permease subunit